MPARLPTKGSPAQRCSEVASIQVTSKIESSANIVCASRALIRGGMVWHHDER